MILSQITDRTDTNNIIFFTSCLHITSLSTDFIFFLFGCRIRPFLPLRNKEKNHADIHAHIYSVISVRFLLFFDLILQLLISAVQCFICIHTSFENNESGALYSIFIYVDTLVRNILDWYIVIWSTVGLLLEI